MISTNGGAKFSRIIKLGAFGAQELAVVNPFSNKLEINITVENTAAIFIYLRDWSGRLVRWQKYIAAQGLNHLELQNTKNLANGYYSLQIATGDKTVTKGVVKQ